MIILQQCQSYWKKMYSDNQPCIRVFHLIDSMNIGGTQAMLVGLCINSTNQQNKIHHHVISLYGNRSLFFEDKLIQSGIKVTNLAPSKKWLLFIIIRLIYIIIFKHFDILHLHLRVSSIQGSVLGTLFGKKKKIIIGVYEQKFQIPGTYRIFSRLSAFAGAFVAMSEADKIDLIQIGIRDNKITVILPLVNLEGANDHHDELKLKFCKQYNIPIDHLILMSLSRLNADRQIRKIIDIMPGILKKINKVTLVFVGDGPEKIQLLKLAEEFNIRDNVVFTGIRYDIWNVLPCCDVFLSASADCLVSLAGIEAMACKRPLIAYNINPMEEPESLCTSRGYYITTRDQASFTNAALKMLSDENLRNEFGEKAKNNVFSDITVSVEKSVINYSKLYKDIFNNNNLQLSDFNI
jgi:glycosyltransferase involved in cell wall biosynthesis